MMGLLAFASVAFLAPLVPAATIAPAMNDLILGFRATANPGQTLDLEVDLGPVSQFYSAAAGSTIPLPKLAVQDLSATFGASWFTRPDLFWGAVATTGRAAGTPDSHAPVGTLWATAPASAGTNALNRGSVFAQKQASAAIEAMLVSGALGTLNGATATANSTGAAVIDATQAGSWTVQDLKTQGTSFGYFNPTVDSVATVPSGGQVVAQLFELQPGTGTGTLLGNLILTRTGLSFQATGGGGGGGGATGSLTVTISPAGAASAGAQWQVDGGALQNSGATVSGLSTGAHTVAFSTVSGFTTPASENVTITSGATTTTNGTYTVVVAQTGSLTVTISPAGAVSAGAQWRVDGGALQNSGATVSGLSTGSHAVAFSTVSGYTTPTGQNVTITSGTTATASGTYTIIGTPTGSLTVTISPAGAVSAGAQWRVDGGALQASGATVSGLSTGSHAVAFSTVSGYTTPAGQNVTITSGATATANGTYTSGSVAIPAGTFSGLIAGTTPSSAVGLVTITTLANGTFTAKLTAGKKSYTLKAQFDTAGNWSGTLGPVTTTLQVDLVHTQITGLATSGTVSAPLLARAVVYDKTHSVPDALVGSYTVLLPANTNSAYATAPQGAGIGLLTIKSTGAINFTGTLSDGTKVTQTAVLLNDNTWSVYIPVYNTGAVAGWVTFAPIPGVSDLEGDVSWLKPAQPGKYFADGFATVLPLVGAKYTAPAAQVLNLSNSAANARVIFGAGNLTSVLTNLVTVAANNKVTPVSGGAAKLTLTITPKAGLFSGSFVHPVTSKAVKFSGELLESQEFGLGYFLGTDASGFVTFEPAP